MKSTCAARRFCACPDCRAFSFDAEGGAHRGTPISTGDERRRARANYAPTHRGGTR